MNKQAYYALAAALAKHFNQPIDSVLRGESFALKAPEAALLGENIQQRSDFLKQINMILTRRVKNYLVQQKKALLVVNKLAVIWLILIIHKMALN